MMHIFHQEVKLYSLTGIVSYQKHKYQYFNTVCISCLIKHVNLYIEILRDGFSLAKNARQIELKIKKRFH